MSTNDWQITFRISGAFLALSLIGLVLPLEPRISLVCWIVGGLSLPICLIAAKKLKDCEKVDSLADAAWLKDGQYSEELFDVADSD